MAQGPSDTILVVIRITLWIQESKVRNPDPPDRWRFVLSEHIVFLLYVLLPQRHASQRSVTVLMICHQSKESSAFFQAEWIPMLA